MSSDSSKEKDFLDELYERMKKKLELLYVKTDYPLCYDSAELKEYKPPEQKIDDKDLETVYRFISDLYNIPIDELKKVKIIYKKLPLGVDGLYKDGKIFLDKDNSENKTKKLLTLVHEFTHYVQDYKKAFIWNYKSFDEYLSNYKSDSNEKMARYTEKLFAKYLLRNSYN